MTEKIKWLGWSKKTFEKAKKDGKPVLLDISAVWCHWCHVMDDTSYSNDEVVKTINKNFIPVRVDTDRRPDINERYNQGGWPTTVMLTANGETITGGMYFPPQQLLTLLQLTKQYYDENKKELLSRGFKEKIDIKETSGVIDEKTVDNVIWNLTSMVDFEHGGFGIEPKFPFPELLELFLARYRKVKDERLLKVVTMALDGMLGIYDKIEGGFYRYSVTREWSTPHYEKLLDVNAKLIINYLHAFEVTKNQKYKKIAEETLDYIERVFLDKKSFYFYGSQDADEEYYKASENERKKMKRPSVDKTLFTNLNCYSILAFLEASRILKNKRYEEIALKVISFLLKNCGQGGMCHYYDGKPHGLGILTDQAGMILCLVEAYRLTNNKKYLKEIEKFIKYIKKNFVHSKSGTFFDRVVRFDDVGYLKQRNISLVDNLLLAEAFAKLFTLTKNKEYKKIAEKVLIYFSDKHENHSLHSGLYALAVQKYFESTGN